MSQTETPAAAASSDGLAAHLRGFGLAGIVFGTIFAFTGRIWMVIIAHAFFDLTALTMIYWNCESNVAHLIFK